MSGSLDVEKDIAVREANFVSFQWNCFLFITIKTLFISWFHVADLEFQNIISFCGLFALSPELLD